MPAPTFASAGPDAELVAAAPGYIAFVERKSDFAPVALIGWRVGSTASEPIVAGSVEPVAAIQLPSGQIQTPARLFRTMEDWRSSL